MPFPILIFLSQSLLEFRWPELDSVARLLGVHLHFDRAQDEKSAFLLAEVDNEQEARLLGSRCVLIRHIIHYWADADNHEELHASLLVQPHLWQQYRDDTSFKITSAGFNQKIKLDRQRDIAESLSYMEFQGKIDLNEPDLELCVYEDHVENMKGCTWQQTLRHVWAGRKICDGQRHLVDRFSIKERAYIGNTTMEAEVSLVMANMALAAPGTLIYDPFAGTGSMLYTAAHFGAYVLGSDVDDTSIVDAAAQYGVLGRLAGCLVLDITQHPWRGEGLFDAVLCDPPYGVRAGAKRIGRTDRPLRDEPFLRRDGQIDHVREDYLPPFAPWPMDEVLEELLQVSRRLLKPGGRLVYFLPTITAEYTDADVPQLDGLRLIANSEQSFGKWARRLITMERIADSIVPASNGTSRASSRPAHADFHRKYFEQRTSSPNVGR